MFWVCFFFCIWGNANLSRFLSLELAAGFLTNGKREEAKGGRGSWSATARLATWNSREKFRLFLSFLAVIWHQGSTRFASLSLAGLFAYLSDASCRLCTMKRRMLPHTCLKRQSSPQDWWWISGLDCKVFKLVSERHDMLLKHSCRLCRSSGGWIFLKWGTSLTQWQMELPWF